uniref:Protein kinase domain-containing protein n=1 Tax=Panagrellus redivivus TaxID=6233 RepID=A0A7E4ZZM4_PANRE
MMGHDSLSIRFVQEVADACIRAPNSKLSAACAPGNMRLSLLLLIVLITGGQSLSLEKLWNNWLGFTQPSAADPAEQILNGGSNDTDLDGFADNATESANNEEQEEVIGTVIHLTPSTESPDDYEDTTTPDILNVSVQTADSATVNTDNHEFADSTAVSGSPDHIPTTTSVAIDETEEVLLNGDSYLSDNETTFEVIDGSGEEPLNLLAENENVTETLTTTTDSATTLEHHHHHGHHHHHHTATPSTPTATQSWKGLSTGLTALDGWLNSSL